MGTSPPRRVVNKGPPCRPPQVAGRPWGTSPPIASSTEALRVPPSTRLTLQRDRMGKASGNQTAWKSDIL
eukprot:2338648-Alexandrium_andersonii.AAC.1